jgi:hypothetical protein
MASMFERTTRVSEAGIFTVAVFKDLEWAARGLDALAGRGFAAESLSVIVKESAEAEALVSRVLGCPAPPRDLARVGPVIAEGPLVAALDGPTHDLSRLGIAGTMRRVGYQPHDGQIFETLTGRGGVLVAVHSEPRAADALAVMHSYGGGNAAIGAWHGRV